MSHIATVNVQITDLSALEKALEKFDATLIRDKASFKAYYGDTNTKCKHVVELNKNRTGYSIGLRQLAQAGEAYELACDFFDGSLEKAFGKKLVGLSNEYAATVAETMLSKRGYRLRREIDEQNHIKLVATA